MPVLPPPPSTLTGPLGDYLQVVWRSLNGMPNMSYFSGANNPNSMVTGVPGDVAVYVGLVSSNSRHWLKGGTTRVPSQTGWVQVMVT